MAPKKYVLQIVYVIIMYNYVKFVPNGATPFEILMNTGIVDLTKPINNESSIIFGTSFFLDLYTSSFAN